MALSDPSLKGIERLENANRKLPVPLEVNIAGRNLKITDYNELFDLNKINGDSRRITTLTIKTVSTYKQKVDPNCKYSDELQQLPQLNGNHSSTVQPPLRTTTNREANKLLKSLESNQDLKLNNNRANKLSDKENQLNQVLKHGELGDDLVRHKPGDLEQRKIKQITIEKSIQVDPKSKQRNFNDDHQLNGINSRTYGGGPKAGDDSFFRNSKRSSSLRQINLSTKHDPPSDLRATASPSNRYFVSNRFDLSNNSPNRVSTIDRQMADQPKHGDQKGKLFYFNGTNNQMLFKDEIDNLPINSPQTSSTTNPIDDKFKKHLNASLNSSFNSNYNQKDGNNNRSLKASTLISRTNATNAGSSITPSSKQQHAHSQVNHSQINPQSQLLYNPNQKQSNQFNQINYLEQYHQPNQQVNNSLMRKKLTNRKLSAGGNADEINCDEFVSELKTKIANNNQTTSSPSTAAKLNHYNSNSLGRERSGHLILDTSTMPHIGRTSRQSNNLVNNFETNQQTKPSLTSSIRRNESFQRASEHRIRMEPVRRSNRSAKDVQTSTTKSETTMDKLDSQLNKNTQRFSYLGSQAVNGYQSEPCNRQSNDNLANETCTTDDWNTTLDTNAETRSSTDDRSKQFKKLDKYGFFIDEHQKSNRTGSIKKEDEQAKRTNSEIERRRELKWLEMLNHWDRYMQKRWNKICERCRKGIPTSLRGKAWFYLCAAHKQKRNQPDLFQLLDQQPGNESINDEIIKDLHRQFPDHFMFSGTNNKGQQDLFTVLKNFSIIKPEIAYCQGEAPIASVLLMHLPVEDAFFALVQLCDHYLSGYFTPGLETIQMHGKMLTSLLKRHNNYVYKVLKKQRIDSTMYMTEWFMCVFARTLPWPTVLRVWDMFFCEGIKIVFRVALVILNSIEPELRRAKCNTNDKLAETMEILKDLPKKYLEIEYLLPKVIEMHLSEKDLEVEHYNVLKKLKKKK